MKPFFPKLAFSKHATRFWKGLSREWVGHVRHRESAGIISPRRALWIIPMIKNILLLLGLAAVFAAGTACVTSSKADPNSPAQKSPPPPR